MRTTRILLAAGCVGGIALGTLASALRANAQYYPPPPGYGYGYRTWNGAHPVTRCRAKTVRHTKAQLVADGVPGTAVHRVTLFRAGTVPRIRDRSMGLVGATTAEWF